MMSQPCLRATVGTIVWGISLRCSLPCIKHHQQKQSCLILFMCGGLRGVEGGGAGGGLCS